MIFLTSRFPFEAVQLLNQLRITTQECINIFPTVEEAEANLYKIPDIVLLDDNLGLTNLLYLTQSIKIYDSKIEVVWFCAEEYKELHSLHESYGVYQCFHKEQTSLELLSFTIMEICKREKEGQKQKRKEYLRKNLLSCLM
ncbi:hypothetical protein [Nafulsella turpanensis]|uniref:hypothetical protein n=1 Tax=Nafulsella turpanensis TaxID=1265690 RepID=UPI00034C1B20|nr:hypothetical protein [Nafulsella turpanensis]